MSWQPMQRWKCRKDLGQRLLPGETLGLMVVDNNPSNRRVRGRKQIFLQYALFFALTFSAT